MATNDQMDQLFLDEASDLLSEASYALVEAERNGDLPKALDVAFRAFHSVKGGAQMVGMGEMGQLLHHLEDVLAAAKSGQTPLNSDRLSLLLEGIDHMETEIETVRRGEDPTGFAAKYTLLLQRLKELPAAKTAAAAPPLANRRDSPTSTEMHLTFLYFLLDPSASMPEVTALVLTQQYEMAGRLLSLEVGEDGDRMVIVGSLETTYSDQALEKLCAAGEVEKVYVRSYRQCFSAPNPTTTTPMRFKIRILLVEDDEILLQIATRVLRTQGYETIAVSSAEMALEKIAVEKFHVLVTDIALPGMDGLELVRLVKKRDSLAQIVVMTGSVTMQKALQALELGANEYLLKPFTDMGQLTQAVRNCEYKLARWWALINEISCR